MAGYGKNNAWGGGGQRNDYYGGQQNQMRGMGQQQGYHQQPVQNISYPSRGSHQQNYNYNVGGGGGSNVMRSGQQTSQQDAQGRVFTGTVTKLHDTFGFIDEEVFFQISVVKGQVPRVDDKVLVEATYNQNMPFKWNATRVQLMPTQVGGMGGVQIGGFQAQQNRGFDARDNIQRNQRDNRMRNRSPQNKRDFRGNSDVQRGPQQERSSRKRSRSPSRRSRSPKGRSKSRSSRSPARRRARTSLARYHVSVPKVSLHFPVSNVMELKKRYNNLYVPSDFFTANHSWNEAFPIDAPFKVQFPSTFHVMPKDLVEPVIKNKFQLDPPDADYTWVAKVMLLSSPGIEELYEKTCNFTEKSGSDKDSVVHPTRAIKFLVGLKGKSETMALGGAWSPSLDGADPKNDPSVLIKTAIRTCGALTGIDLSGCTKWTKFIQVHYRRQESSSKPARTETVVIFMPDIWTAMPNKLDYDKRCELYAKACEAKCEGKPVEQLDLDGESEGQKDEEGNGAADESMEEDGKEASSGEPTHWKLLDPKTMKVNELKQELEARGQSSKGLKSQLQARLQKMLKNEEDAEEASEKKEDGEGDDTAAQEEKEKSDQENEKEKEKEESSGLPEKEKEKIKSNYKTPSSPCLFVHPNTKAKGGKFDCKVESLSVLLDYRSDDNKEGTFEVSLFVELFNEMIMRDSAFRLYTAIVNGSERQKVLDKVKAEQKAVEDKKRAEEKAVEDKRKAEEKAEDEKRKAEEKAEEERIKEEEAKEDEEAQESEEEEGDDDDEDEAKREAKLKKKLEKEDAKRKKLEKRKEAAKKREEERREEDKRIRDERKKEEEKRREEAKKRKDEEEKKKKEEPPKVIVTKHKDLLFSCAYFDLGHTGYFETRDVEDIMMALDLKLSRAELKKVYSNLSGVHTSKDQINYRILTDREEGAEEEVYKTVTAEELALGFANFIPGAGKDFSKKSSGPQESSDGMIKFRGTLLDVKQLLSNLEKSESVRTAADSKLVSLQKQLEGVKGDRDRFLDQRDKLTIELKEAKQRIKQVEDEKAASLVEKHKYNVCLREILYKIKPIIEPPVIKADKESLTEPMENGNKAVENGDEPPTEEAAMDTTEQKKDEDQLEAA